MSVAFSTPSEASSRLETGRFVAWSDTALPDRRDLALLAVEKMRVPMMISDPRLPDNPIVLANQAFLDLTGYTSEELIGRNCRLLQGPDTAPEAIESMRRDLAAERDFEIELLNYRKDGTPFWNALQVSSLRDDNGAIVYYFASQQDVTREHEARAIKAAELALLREVDHRARNALALVQGIVRLSRASEVDEYARSVQGRVEVLALAHSLLAERRWHPVPLDELVAGVTRSAGLSGVTVDGPQVGVAPDQVQPLALVIHELLDNAHRHGALSVPDGNLHIAWSREPNEVSIRIVERGGPPPATERRKGFGLTVVDAVTARQLRGKVTLDWPREGLTGELVIPAMAN